MPKPDVDACEGISDWGASRRKRQALDPNYRMPDYAEGRNTRRLQESWPSTAVGKKMTSSGRIL